MTETPRGGYQFPDDEDDDAVMEVSDIRQSTEFKSILDAARMWSHELAMEIIPNADSQDRPEYQEQLDDLEAAIAALGGDDL